MSAVERYASGSPYEASVGFSRAVRIGDRLITSLTAPLMPGGAPPPAGTEAQWRRCLAIFDEVLRAAGGTLADVVRTEVHYTAEADVDAIDRLHFEQFGAVRPVTKMLPVAGLAEPGWLLELEIEAVLQPAGARPPDGRERRPAA